MGGKGHHSRYGAAKVKRFSHLTSSWLFLHAGAGARAKIPTYLEGVASLSFLAVPSFFQMHLHEAASDTGWL